MGQPAPRQTAKMLIPKADRKKIHEYLFREGVLVAKKDYNLPKHNDIDTKNPTSSRLASPLPPADTSRPNSHGNTTTTPSPLRASTTSANGFTSPLRLSQLPTSSNNDRTLLPVE